ncbi:hypothetical protein A3860_36870 [Niastella vici]|uniref:Uncharacterized protein n=1 Tax=Niastella vici TaxID=1703345 RepID=A0A1V9FMT6_9BACT|nr:hypothetical protein A3860_36870 [Niastella vici]
MRLYEGAFAEKYKPAILRTKDNAPVCEYLYFNGADLAVYENLILVIFFEESTAGCKESPERQYIKLLPFRRSIIEKLRLSKPSKHNE